jgi:hypothetical protein
MILQDSWTIEDEYELGNLVSEELGNWPKTQWVDAELEPLYLNNGKMGYIATCYFTDPDFM